MKRPAVTAVLLFIVSGLLQGAASLSEAAPLTVAQIKRDDQAHNNQLPRAVSFREVRERGLLVKVWVNQAGPYTFAIDTGAGITLIGRRAAADAQTDRAGGSVALGGLSGVANSKGRTTIIRALAIGDPENALPANQKAIIIDNLPDGVDGVLDPAEAYFPFGFSIDLPNHELAAFDPKLNPLRARNPPEGGTVVRWLSNGAGRRPFVRLSDGRLALLDTGSGFGLAISESSGNANLREHRSEVRDIGGGEVTSKRVQPQTVSIGDMTLRAVPTDILYGVEKGAPILLGRDALYPFRLTFDPLQRLIEIAPMLR